MKLDKQKEAKEDLDIVGKIRNTLVILILLSCVMSVKASDTQFQFYLNEASKYKNFGNLLEAAKLYSMALELNKECGVCFYELGRISLEAKNYKDAEMYYKNALRIDSTNYWYKRELAEVYKRNGKFNEAIDLFKTIHGGNKLERYYDLASLYEITGKYSLAIDVVDSIESSVGSTNPALTLVKYELMKKAGMDSLSYSFLENNVKKYKDNPEILVTWVQRNVRDEKYDIEKLINSNLDVLLSDYKSAEYVINYYSRLEEQEKIQTLIDRIYANNTLSKEEKFQLVLALKEPLKWKFLKTIMEEDSVSHALLLKAASDYKEEDPEKAVFLYGQLINDYKRNVKVWEQYLLSINSLGDYSLMYEKSNEALANTDGSALIYLFKGLSLMINREYKKALKPLRKALLMKEENQYLKSQISSYLAEVYYQRGKLDSTFHYYEKALNQYPENTLVLNNYAYYLSENDQNLEKASKMSSVAVKNEPDNAVYLDTYAWILYKNGKFNEALFYIEKAIENSETENAVIRDHYGDILHSNGLILRAQEEWEKAYELSGDKKIKKKIRKINVGSE